jgi:small subunit ribosomal protein S2
MDIFLKGYRRGMCIIDLEQTSFMLRRALGFLVKLVANRGYVLFSGLPPAGEAHLYASFFSSSPWVGGTLTNRKQSFKHLFRTTPDIVSSKSGARFLPSALVLLSEDRNKYFALNEAIRLGIPSIAVCDSHMVPAMSVYPVPGSNSVLSTLRFYLRLFKKVIISGLRSERGRFVSVRRALERKQRFGSRFGPSRNFRRN